MRISDWSSYVCSSDLLPALVESAEGAEDDVVDAARQIAEHAVDATDVVVAVAASGHTPFTLRAIEDARVRGALTIAIGNNASTPVLQAAKHALFLGTGSEIISGSTRMKAGTAQKADRTSTRLNSSN